MWKTEFDINTVTKWADAHRESGLLKYEKPVISPIAPFEIEIPVAAYNDIKNIYVPHEERGGIIFCRIINGEKGFTLQAAEIKEVPNVYVPGAEDKGRSKANTYLPDGNTYRSHLKNNFSKPQSDTVLFPIHFHTHPTADAQRSVEYSNQFIQLNTSKQDQNSAIARFVEFNNVKLRYLNAIVTGHDDDLNIVFYAPGVTPLNFFETKLNRIRGKISDFGKQASDLTENENYKQLISKGVEAIGMLAVGFNMGIIDYAPMLFEEKEYFGSLHSDKPTVIRIPNYDPAKDSDED